MRTLPLLLVITLPFVLSASACERKAAPGGGDAQVAGDALATDGAPPDGTLHDDGGPVDGATGDGGQGDAGVTPCHDFALAECRLHPDCAPDLCYTCSCIPSFEGCRHTTDPAFECPQVGCPQPICCETQLDCQNMGGECAPPGTPWGCGVCTTDPGDCSADGDCAAGSICEPIPCSCNGAYQCVPGCGTNEPCPIGTTCSGGDHPRCLPTTCTGQPSCPPDFDCDSGQCTRRPCVSDLHCDHFCVNGLCYEGEGECRLPTP